MMVFFNLGLGTIINYIARKLRVVLRFESQVILWLDVDKRQEIANNISPIYGFKNCVGLIDGNLFPFEYKPTLNGEDYSSRKLRYTVVNAFITCDIDARVQAIVIGWPGSEHDIQIWIFFGMSKIYNSSKSISVG